VIAAASSPSQQASRSSSLRRASPMSRAGAQNAAPLAKAPEGKAHHRRMAVGRIGRCSQPCALSAASRHRFLSSLVLIDLFTAQIASRPSVHLVATRDARAAAAAEAGRIDQHLAKRKMCSKGVANWPSLCFASRCFVVDPDARKCYIAKAIA
jgi:hypothetical protein